MRHTGEKKPVHQSSGSVRSTANQPSEPDGHHDKIPGFLQDPEALGDLSFQDMAQITLDAIGDAVLVVNPQGQVIYLNKVAETMTGWSSEQALGCRVDEIFVIIDGTSRQPQEGPAQKAINEDRIVELALGSVLIRQDGTEVAIEDSAAPIRNRSGKAVGAVIVFHDAQQSRSQIQKMSHLAQHDLLTGLPNRVLLTERLTQALGMAKRHHKLAALLFVDLNNFKLVNDAFGHAVGDLLLRDVAETIVDCLRATDTVSRHGGDEFVVLLPEVDDHHAPEQVADKLLAQFAQPRTIDGHEMHVTLSIGISIYPEHGMEPDSLMRKADAAMYACKRNGRSSYQTADSPSAHYQPTPKDAPPPFHRVGR